MAGFQFFLVMLVMTAVIVLPIVVLIKVIGIISAYLSHASKKDVRIKYKELLDIYYINKNKIEYDEDNKRVNYDTRTYHEWNTNGALVRIRFNFIDWLRICHFFKIETKRAAKTNNLETQKENLELILNSVQNDIDRIRKQSEEETECAKKINQQIFNNLTKGE